MKRSRMIDGIALLIIGGLMLAMSSAFQPMFYSPYGGPFSAAFTIMRIASAIAIIAGAAMLIMPVAALVHHSFSSRKGR